MADLMTQKYVIGKSEMNEAAGFNILKAISTYINILSEDKTNPKIMTYKTDNPVSKFEIASNNSRIGVIVNTEQIGLLLLNMIKDIYESPDDMIYAFIRLLKDRCVGNQNNEYSVQEIIDLITKNGIKTYNVYELKNIAQDSKCNVNHMIIYSLEKIYRNILDYQVPD